MSNENINSKLLNDENDEKENGKLSTEQLDFVSKLAQFNEFNSNELKSNLEKIKCDEDIVTDNQLIIHKFEDPAIQAFKRGISPINVPAQPTKSEFEPRKLSLDRFSKFGAPKNLPQNNDRENTIFKTNDEEEYPEDLKDSLQDDVAKDVDLAHNDLTADENNEHLESRFDLPQHNSTKIEEAEGNEEPIERSLLSTVDSKLEECEYPTKMIQDTNFVVSNSNEKEDFSEDRVNEINEEIQKIGFNIKNITEKSINQRDFFETEVKHQKKSTTLTLSLSLAINIGK